MTGCSTKRSGYTGNLINLALFSLTMLFLSPLTADETPLHVEGSETINAEALIDLVLEQPALVIIDARIASDLREGYIEGAINLSNIHTNCDSLREVVEILETPVALYCNGVKCKRSFESAKIAHACGYTNLYWFRGGMEEWSSKQYPIMQQN